MTRACDSRILTLLATVCGESELSTTNWSGWSTSLSPNSSARARPLQLRGELREHVRAGLVVREGEEVGGHAVEAQAARRAEVERPVQTREVRRVDVAQHTLLLPHGELQEALARDRPVPHLVRVRDADEPEPRGRPLPCLWNHRVLFVPPSTLGFWTGALFPACRKVKIYAVNVPGSLPISRAWRNRVSLAVRRHSRESTVRRDVYLRT
jgi:hypothetical protein